MRLMKSVIVAVLAFAAMHTPASSNENNAPSSARLLILGSAHLSQMDSFERRLIEDVVERLVAYKPDMMGVELAPGWTVHMMLQEPEKHRDTLNTYGYLHVSLGQLAQLHLGKDWAAINATFENHDGVCARTPATEECVLEALAAYDPLSGYLRWSYMDADAKLKFAETNRVIAERLERLHTANNESVVIAAAVARRLGHHRLYPVDDHMEKGPQGILLDQIGEGLQPILDFWAASTPLKQTYRKQYEQALSSSKEKGSYVPFYLWLNDPNYARLDYASQFEQMDTGEVGESGKIFRRYWDSRGLRMASHITDHFARKPNAKMVYVVGAAHVGPLREQLSYSRWLKLDSVDDVLVGK